MTVVASAPAVGSTLDFPECGVTLGEQIEGEPHCAVPEPPSPSTPPSQPLSSSIPRLSSASLTRLTVLCLTTFTLVSNVGVLALPFDADAWRADLSYTTAGGYTLTVGSSQ